MIVHEGARVRRLVRGHSLNARPDQPGDDAAGDDQPSSGEQDSGRGAVPAVAVSVRRLTVVARQQQPPVAGKNRYRKPVPGPVVLRMESAAVRSSLQARVVPFDHVTEGVHVLREA